MRLLLVFLKEPIPGKVKTRLAKDVGDDEAARYYKALVEVLLRQLQGLQNCRIRFCYTPDDADEAIRFWLLPEMGATSSATEGLYLSPHSTHTEQPTQEIDFQPQGDGHLGDRLDRAFTQGFADGFDQIAVIGSDCPDCGGRWINAMFSRLGPESASDIMIGPSTGGGYYLLALKSPTPELFSHIPWGSEQVFAATTSVVESLGQSIEPLPELSDINNLSDWQSLLASPLGAAMKKALGEPLDDGLAGLT